MSDRTFKQYTIEREVGKGGMATIYLAHERDTGRAVALKFLLPHISTNQTFVRQFMEEFRANQLLRHPNIVETIEGGEHDGKWFMAMEFLDGGSLKDLLRKDLRLPLDLAVHVVINVLKGLQHSHRSGIVHQDMKPANLMWQQDGSIKIADFGISRIASPDLWTATGRIKGTPAYMAPEQAKGQEPTYKWDIFSTGVVLYELLAGFNPFGAKDPQEAIRKILGESPVPLMRAHPAMPHEIERIVARMLEKDPDQRYPNVDTILIELQKLTQRLRLDYSQEVLRDWLLEPERIGQALAVRRGRAYLEDGRKLLAAGRKLADVGLWTVYRAALVDRTNREAAQALHEAARDHGFLLQKSNSMAAQEIEKRLQAEPDDISLLLQAARSYRADANILQTFFYARMALSIAPLDDQVRQQVEKVIGLGKIAHL